MGNILVTRSSLPLKEEFISEIESIWDSHWLTNMGPKHEKFRDNLREYLGISNIDLLTNGHMALELSMQALGLKGEVITTPFTFASTTHAIVRNGLTPVFCDIKSEDFTIDETKIEGLITENTSAIVPVHVYGNICNIEEIQRIAQKYELKVIYDAAHAFGETYNGVGIGNFGDVSCFSFHATKVFNSIEGGAVCFQDENFGKTVNRLKNFGIQGQEIVTDVGPNAKMNEFCAAMGICNLRHVEEEIEKRSVVVERYRNRLSGVDGIYLNPLQEEVKANYAYFPVVFNKQRFGVGRDEVFDELAREGISARKYFYPLTNTFDCYQGRFEVGRTPVAMDISERVLTLPLYADLELADVDRICDVILRCKKQ